MTTLFVVGTGRCGTYSMFEAFGRMGYQSAHEANGQATIPVAWRYATGQMDADYAKTILASLDFVQVEVDHKYTELVPLLLEDDRTRFLWVRRNRKDTVRSMVDRGWYRLNDDSTPPVMWLYWSIGPDGKAHTTANPNSAGHRTKGFEVGSVSQARWMQMRQFEKCGWWVDYVHWLLERYEDDPRFYTVDIETVTPEQLQKIAADVFDGEPGLLDGVPHRSREWRQHDFGG